MKPATNTPSVSVIMPVYNSERFLKQSVDSILGQTFTDFELIAVDDGSTDSCGKLLDDYAKQDARIIVIHQKNTGIVDALNTGIEASTGQYIARQDSDDVSFPTRLQEQVAVLEKDPEIILVTGTFEVFDEDDEYLYREILPADDADIKRTMYLRNPIGHGSVLFRRSAYETSGAYSNTVGPTEDYDLWLRLSEQGKFKAVEAAVFHWRVNTKGITSLNNTAQLSMMRQHIDELWVRVPPYPIGASELRRRGNHYRKLYAKRGIDMKNMLLADNAQLAIKMLRRGRLIAGLYQLLSVALVGRSGLKAVAQRFYYIQRGTSAAVRRRLRGTRS